MRQGQQLVCVGGQNNGATVTSHCARIFCIPVKYVIGEQRVVTWVCEVYMPEHEKNIAVYNRTIMFADDVLTTPIDKTLFDAMIEATPKDGAILEFGSGTSTFHIAQKRIIYSIEDKQQFFGIFNDPKYAILCPLAADNWYAGETLKNILPPLKYNVLFVDGPDTDSRNSGLLKNLDLFNTNCEIFFDDYCNGEMREGMEAIAEKIGRPLEPFTGCVKPWARIRKAAS